MKAIEILKEYKTIDYGCDMSDLYERCDEAIEELEALQAKIKELEDPKTCERCKHYDRNNGCNLTYWIDYNSGYGFECGDKDFCSRYEPKDNQ